MDIKKKKDELVKQFNEVEQQINQLLTLREQTRGKLILLEEQEKETKK